MKNYSSLGPTHQLTIHSFKQLGISSERSCDSIQFRLFIQQISHNRQFTKIKTQYYIDNDFDCILGRVSRPLLDDLRDLSAVYSISISEM